MRYLKLLLVLVCGALLVNPPEIESCGPFLPSAQFGYINNPSSEFMKGELGVLQPGYYRKNLVVAYRYLTGERLTPEEIDAISPKSEPPETYPKGFENTGSLSIARWLKTRSAVAGVGRAENIQWERVAGEDGGTYRAFRNCLDGAFENAAATLEARIKSWGPSGPLTVDWVRGQDEVFANCGGDKWDWNAKPPRIVRAEFHAPAPLGPGAEPLLAADRRYQTAAALFYGEKYEESAEAFRAIARDSNSPWRGMGQYLAARALIRGATVGGNNDLLGAAEAALKSVLENPAQASVHDSARGLLNFVKGQARPQDRMVELGGLLSKPQPGAQFRQSLTDFTMLWDRDNQARSDRIDLADWITTFQGRNPEHAIERWRAGGGEAWLVAALTSVNPADPAAPELAEAARKITPASPAYASAAYHGIRILTARNARDEARKWAGEAVATPVGVSAHNAFLAERMALARNLDEFLRDAARTPVAATDTTPDERIDAQGLKLDADPALDSDAALIFNQRLPLESWRQAAAGAILTTRLRGEVAQAGWVRAVLLGRSAQARSMAQLTARLRPALADEMRKYADEQTEPAATFQAAYTMLRNPGLRPLLLTGFGRLTTVERIDDLRDNWWAAGGNRSSPAAMPPEQPRPAPMAEFLPPRQASEGASEWQALNAAAPFAPDYLCSQTVKWAAGHREDPRVPEALHLCVRATRYGKAGPETSNWSRRAFQLLHTRYPKSEWAGKTKYWY
jgi:hypothetical protein